jgi:adenine-specific DNA-methyltransferase
MSSAATAQSAENAAKRKALGAFYTPPELADALVEWAVKDRSATIFDPSHGDGRFLSAGLKRLSALGAPSPGQQVFGAELDGSAAKLARASTGIPIGNLFEGDFFAADLDHWGGQQFDAIAGNPPYVRHHLLSAESKGLARMHAERLGISISERADAWAYFCASLLGYLAPEGRLALLLPGAVLHADYALSLLHALSEARGRVRLIRIQKRLFPEVSERTVVMLIDGRRCESAGVDYREVADLGELRKVLGARSSSGWRKGGPVGESVSDPALRLRTRLQWFVGQDVAEAWARATESSSVRRLGEIAEIRIGVVTGANRFFVLDEETAKKMRGRGVTTVPIVSRGSWLRKVRWTDEDQEEREGKPSQLLIVDDDRPKKRKALLEAIEEAEERGIHERHHCGNRTVWYCLADRRAPDLFLPYMGAQPQRLVLNKARATCTNAIHRVDLKNGEPGAGAIAAASWTALYRLSAELVGRSYGAGVLKLEPNEAVQLRLPVGASGAENLKEIEAALLEEGGSAAESTADRLLLTEQLGLSEADVETLRRACDELQQRRCNG